MYFLKLFCSFFLFYFSFLCTRLYNFVRKIYDMEEEDTSISQKFLKVGLKKSKKQLSFLAPVLEVFIKNTLHILTEKTKERQKSQQRLVKPVPYFFLTMFRPPQDIEPDLLSLTVLNPLLELKLHFPRNRIGDVFVDISSLIRRETPLCSCSQ